MPTFKGTISAVNFRAIIATTNEGWDLSPFDASGKAEQFLTIEVDSTLGTVDLKLPEIANFGGVFGTKINVVALTGATNSVFINATGSDAIGGGTTITLDGDGSNIVLAPISSTQWSAITTL